MTNTVLAALPISRAFDASGLPLGGGLLFTYQAGSNVPQPTYADLTQNVLNSNPVVLDSTGTATIRYLPATAYKLVLTDKTGATVLWSVDNYYPPVSDQASIGAVLYPQSSLEAAVSLVPTNYAYPPGHFNRYGALGDNVTDDHTAVAAAFSTGHLVTASAGSTYYCGTATIALSVKVKASLYGVALRTAVNGATFLNITASGVELRGVEIYGRGNSSYTALERLITWSGTQGVTTPTYVSDLRLVECYLHDVGERAIYSEFGKQAFIQDCHFKNIGYAAVHVLSGLDWEFHGGLIDTVSPGASSNAYGISFTRDPTVSDTLTIIPRSKNCKVTGMTVKNIPLWTALDTHGGEEITFANNIVENCMMAVTIGACPGVAGTSMFAPKNCKSIGNCGTNPTPVSGNFGVGINGAGTAVGTTIDAAEGCASIGDKMTGFGVTASGTNGGYQFSYTEGLVVSGSQANECFPHGFVLYHDNKGFTITGCSAIDPYDSTITNCSGINLNAGYNTGTISGNSFLKINAALGTTVGNTAIAEVTSTSSATAIGANYNTMTNYVTGVSGFTLTALTDSTGGTPGNTIAAVPGGYTQATLANQLSSLTAAINAIETALRTAGLMQ